MRMDDGLAVLDDWNTHTVEKAHKYTGDGRTVMGQQHSPAYDIHGENPCASNLLTCSHLCLIAAGGERATCECPDHFISLMVGFTVQCVADCSSTQFRCGDNERYFQCQDGNCTYPADICNGHQDCADGSDEDPALCKHVTCDPMGDFRCDNDLC
ncbi:hypothetical protein CRUP_003860, partial [Coryphaenoides rupestris]